MTDVILLTYGEPRTAGFGQHLDYSRRILEGLTRRVAPIPRWLVPALALRRALLRTTTWTIERYGSPLEEITARQAEALSRALAVRVPGRAFRVRVAYEFRDPDLTRMLADAPPDALVVPLYLAESAFTHELASDALARLDGSRRGARVLPALPSETLAELSARHVERELESRGIEPGSDWALVLAAHGTLVDPPRPMNTGREATEAVAQGIARRLEGRFGAVVPAWLNHALGGRWTEPAADVAVRRLADRGFRRIVYFPYGFLADNAESQLEGRILLRAEQRLERVVHLPCLNADAGLLAVLADSIAGS